MAPIRIPRSCVLILRCLFGVASYGYILHPLVERMIVRLLLLLLCLPLLCNPFAVLLPNSCQRVGREVGNTTKPHDQNCS